MTSKGKSEIQQVSECLVANILFCDLLQKKQLLANFSKKNQVLFRSSTSFSGPLVTLIRVQHSNIKPNNSAEQ